VVTVAEGARFVTQSINGTIAIVEVETGGLSMNPTPNGWPRISSGLYYRDPAAMIDWLCAAFGFEVKIKVVGEDGRIEHSELTYGDGLIMVGGERVGSAARWGVEFRSPASALCNT